jgi:YesN/AraC family two-component response regulator
MDGLEVLARLKENDPSICAIVLTGYPTEETARKALQLGASEYCVKPMDNEELENKVAAVLKLSQRKK